MKKIKIFKKSAVLAVVLLLLSTNISFADEADAQKAISFIYLNGSNTNSEKAKEDYTKGTYAMQKQIRKIFESDEFVQKHILGNGEYTIKETPDILFWGFQSQQSLNKVNDNLQLVSLVSPKIAQSVRRLISFSLHDAIWVQKDNNMQKIIDQLHHKVTESHEKGEKVVLLGYSAGSFVTYNYLLHKLKAVDIDPFLGKAGNNKKCTCADAIIASKLGFPLSSGGIVFNPNEEQLKEAYSKLDGYTKTVCLPDNSVSGIINFGSPLSLFYSDMVGNDSFLTNEQVFSFFKHMQEADIFLLTINFADDPLGFPIGRNITVKELETEFNHTLNKKAKGFVYNYSSVKSPATFATSHTSYWRHPKKFAKMCRDAFKKGLENFYGTSL